MSTRIRGTSGSGSPATSFSKVASVQTTVPSGGFFSWALLFFFPAATRSAALALAFSFSMTCSGACTTTKPEVS